MPSLLKFVFGLILVNTLVILAAAAFTDFTPWICALGLTITLNLIVFCERPGPAKAPPAVNEIFFRTRDKIKACEPIEKGTAKLLLMISPAGYIVAILMCGHKTSPVCLATMIALGLLVLVNLGWLIWPEHKNLTGWFIKYYENNIRGWIVMYWLGDNGLVLRVAPRPFWFQVEYVLMKRMRKYSAPHIMLLIGGWVLFKNYWTQVYQMVPSEGLRFPGRWRVRVPGREVTPTQYVNLTDWEAHSMEQVHVERALRVVGGSP